MKDFFLSAWHGLLSLFGLLEASPRNYQYEEELLQAVRDLAFQEGRSEEEVTEDLLTLALTKKGANTAMQYFWETLSYREQQVTALTCLNYTNRQIAAQLQLSPKTIATHVRNVLQKFGVHSKSELRQALQYWDFSAWRNIR